MRFMAAFLLLTVMGAGESLAQSKTGTTIGQFMNIEPGARHAGMGNAGVALDGGIQSVFYNPAALGAMEKGAIQFTHSEWFEGINYDYAAGVLHLKGLGTFMAGVTALNSGDIEVRTVGNPLGTGELYSASDIALSLGYGRKVTSRFSAGLRLNYVHESIWNSSENHATVDVGSVYQLAENGLRLGAGISNVGTNARYSGSDLAIQYDGDPDRYGDNSALPAEQFTDRFPVPILFRVGVAWPKPLGDNSRLLVAVDAFHPSDNTESISGGAEWTYRNTMSLRAGYQNLFQEESAVGLTLGVGIQGGGTGGRFHFDYAWAAHEYLQETHRLTFVLGF